MKEKILILDDDEMILRMMKNILTAESYVVSTETDFLEFEKKDDIKNYNMILLDVMMPGQSGFDVMKKIRDCFDGRILFITAKTAEEDMVYGLGLGADDYIKKPFSPEELKARIRAHLRREKREHHSVIQSGDIVFDLMSKEMKITGKRVELTKGEYEICEFLVRNKGQVFSREQIYEAVFGYDGQSNDSTIATHIRNIRGKLEQFAQDPIETAWGIGYKWKK